MKGMFVQEAADGSEFCHIMERRVGVKLCEQCLQGSPAIRRGERIHW